MKVAWLTGSRKGKARAAMLEQVGIGSKQMLVVGTRAVIQEQVEFKPSSASRSSTSSIASASQQRLALREKLHRRPDLEPHTLMMSATPIPRTLAMTLFADLDISTIDELPPGRTPVVTKLFSDAKREDVIARIRDAVGQGQQVYWVCPLIEESETLDLQNATDTHAELCAALPGRMIGLLHGRMPAAEKAAAMSLFAGGQIAVLVATTVIEVGVDVPNASLMVVEHAERFGLSQLHQLRGRVGRGTQASVCVLLFSAPLSETAKARLKAMLETDDGFEISRRDLDIRGPGEIPRRAPVGRGAAALRRSGDRRRPGRRRPRRRGTTARQRPRGGALSHRPLARRPRRLSQRLTSARGRAFCEGKSRRHRLGPLADARYARDTFSASNDEVFMLHALTRPLC